MESKTPAPRHSDFVFRVRGHLETLGEHLIQLNVRSSHEPMGLPPTPADLRRQRSGKVPGYLMYLIFVLRQCPWHAADFLGAVLRLRRSRSKLDFHNGPYCGDLPDACHHGLQFLQAHHIVLAMFLEEEAGCGSATGLPRPGEYRDLDPFELKAELRARSKALLAHGGSPTIAGMFAFYQHIQAAAIRVLEISSEYDGRFVADSDELP